ncbi:MAG: SpoIVB peptidase [Clostridia bacterium]|nr:SpoIVB peptidase [Clostridia bacterium]
MIRKKLKLICASLLAIIICSANGIGGVIPGLRQGLPVFAGENDPSTVYFRDDTAPASTETLKPVPEKELSEMRLCPGGTPFGIRMNTDGILVVGYAAVETESGMVNPARSAGIVAGDIIRNINGERAYDADVLRETARGSGGKPVALTVLHGDKTSEVTVTPALSASDGEYRLGMWVKSRAAGIGTVTFREPESGRFAGLGHGICDTETGIRLPLASGEVFNVRIDGVRKGESGTPGELRGYFTSGKVGALLENTDFGVYGVMRQQDSTDSGSALPVAPRSDVTEGDATVICTVSGEVPESYSAKIIAVDRAGNDTKNFVIEVTDPRLLEITGGIVQGMSGSPVIQNGKLAGALTHVLVNDPTKGYGIFIENMIAAMRDF